MAAQRLVRARRPPEGADVHMVAAERRVSRAVLVEQLRDAIARRVAGRTSR
jgi:hypothetical protein